MICAKISVGIVTYNSSNDLPRCLASLAEQTFAPHEIIILDNNSPDFDLESFKSVVASFPTLAPTQIISASENRGFGSGHNAILSQITGDYYLMLNPDVQLFPDFLAAAHDFFTVNPTVAALNGLVMYAGSQPPIVYSTGHALFKDRRFEDVGIGTPADLYANARPIFGFNGACPVVSVSALRDVSYAEGPFDHTYFLYGEDDDLNWRMALAGWTSFYTPTCQAWHAAGASGAHKNPVARRSALCNRWLNIVKNDRICFVLLDLPLILSAELLYLALRVFKKPRFLMDYLGAGVMFLQHLPTTLKRRRCSPIRLSRSQERKLFATGAVQRCKIVLKRSFLRSNHRSIWNK